MIVFTATNKVTNEIYVGGTKDGVEEQWARLIVQAEEGGSGDLLSAIRDCGADSFALEMWAYADSPAESRKLIRDACEELNAKAIKTGRAPAPSVNTVTPQENRQSSSPAGTPVSKPVTNLKETNNVTSIRQSEPSNKKDIAHERQSQREHGPVQSIDVRSYLASQRTVEEKQETQEKRVENTPLRQKDSTKDFDDMKEVMMRIEMKRRQNRQSSTTKAKASGSKSVTTMKGTSSTASKKATDTAKPSRSTTVKDKLPTGRVGSAAKEKRIKEAIAKEKMEREAAQAAKVAAEAKEMAEIMAKLDQRTKEAEKIRRSR